MDNRRSGGKLETDLRSVLHFFGDFQEIPSICFITRWARWGSFQNGFVKGKHVSFNCERLDFNQLLGLAKL
jgi:hypothetical protein